MIGCPWDGDDIAIRRITSLADPVDHAVAFATSITTIDPAAEMAVITPAETTARSAIRSPNPRLDFARALTLLQRGGWLARSADPPDIHETAQVSDQAIIGNGVAIGQRTVIDPGVRVLEGTQIGDDCWLRTGAVIGEQGFGFERDEGGRPIRVPHLGGTVIGDCVEIGSLSTVCQGTLVPTVVEDHVKLDDHVHVGHNCHVGQSTMIAAFAELSGGVRVGERVWIGPQASTYQKIRIGDDALIGVGAVVLRNVKPGATVMGRPGIESKG